MCSAFWTQTIFDTGLLSLSLVSQKLVGYISLSFMSPTCRVVSLGLENLTKYVPHFPRPSGPKPILTSVYFPSAWFLKSLLGYVSLSFMAPACREESFHSALRTQPSMCLVSLGLLDLDPNNFLHGFTFPQPGFSKTCWGTFPSASRHQHEETSCFTVPRFPRPSGPK